MIIGQFWGTSDAMCIPGVYCDCEVCNEARLKGGKYKRTRTCFRLSNKVMIDLGADATTQSAIYGPLNEVQHVLFTHTHEDHLNPHMIMQAFWTREKCNLPLNYYFTDEAFEIVRCWRENDWILKGKVKQFEEDGIVKFHKLEYGKKYKISDFEVIPFKGNHVGNMKETSAMYLIILPDGRKLFYGLDSGEYFKETIDALKGFEIDIYVSEATFGVDKICLDGRHMNMTQVRALIDTLKEQGTISDKTTLYLTHISHRGGFDQMEKAIEDLEFPIKTYITYDGMKIL